MYRCKSSNDPVLGLRYDYIIIKYYRDEGLD